MAQKQPAPTPDPKHKHVPDSGEKSADRQTQANQLKKDDTFHYGRSGEASPTNAQASETRQDSKKGPFVHSNEQTPK